MLDVNQTKPGPELKISLSKYKQELHEIKNIDVQAGLTLRRLLNVIAKEIAKIQEQLSDIYEEDFISAHQRLSDLNKILEISTGMLTSVKKPIENFLVSSQWVLTGQKEMPLICQLPYHQYAPHVLTRNFVLCELNDKHRFCRLHNLEWCVICGGDLR